MTQSNIPSDCLDTCTYVFYNYSAILQCPSPEQATDCPGGQAEYIHGKMGPWTPGLIFMILIQVLWSAGRFGSTKHPGTEVDTRFEEMQRQGRYFLVALVVFFYILTLCIAWIMVLCNKVNLDLVKVIHVLSVVGRFGVAVLIIELLRHTFASDSSFEDECAPTEIQIEPNEPVEPTSADEIYCKMSAAIAVSVFLGGLTILPSAALSSSIRPALYGIPLFMEFVLLLAACDVMGSDSERRMSNTTAIIVASCCAVSCVMHLGMITIDFGMSPKQVECLCSELLASDYVGLCFVVDLLFCISFMLSVVVKLHKQYSSA